MHRTLSLLALPLVIVAVTACSTAGSGGTSSASVAATAELPGTSWVVTSVNGQFVDATSPPTIVFAADGTVSGTTGCNQYNGPYEVDGNQITVGALAMTMMLCEGPGGEAETLFAPAMQGATAWAIDAAGNLALSGAGEIKATPTS